MTTGPAARTRLAASPVDTILSWMQGRTVTQGWDVVCAVAYDKINEWFLEQYVDRLIGGEDAVINASVPTAGGIAVQAIDLTLGPPLISFSPTLPPNTVGLTVSFLSGQVKVTQTSNNITNILSTQVITPGDRYALTGYVPLASVQGEVENGHDVVIDVVNGSSFAAELGMPEGAQTLLGQFMQNWLVHNLDGYRYKLGTLNYDDNKTNLTPAGTFQFATQLDETDKTDTGRLLLFIPTTYNPGGGSQTALGLADVVPQGCSTALIISSQALFAGILKSFYETTFSKFGVQATASQNGPGGTYTLTLTAGSVDIKEQSYTFGEDKDGHAINPIHGSVFSGQSSLMHGQTSEHVVVPVTSTSLKASSNQLQISGTLQWPQDLAIAASVPKSEGVHTWGRINMTATVECQTTASVTAIKDTVSLSGTPGVNVRFDASGIANSNFSDMWNKLAGIIAAGSQAALTAFFQVPLPEVNAFAVSNLLFPGENILDFQSVYIPGDIVIFGDVATPGVVVTPGSATLGPAQTKQFSATTGSGEAVQWTAKAMTGSTLAGKISASGLYTAPPAVSQVQFNQITATGQQHPQQAAAALVTLVPQGAQISPAFALIMQDSLAQQFSAALSGAPSQQVTWSMEPQIGTLSREGLYTPPGTVTSPQAVTITATSPSDPSIQGTALIALVAGLPSSIGVTPLQGPPLTPGQAQQFQATMAGGTPASVTWSLLPPIGKITANGVYIAPDTISAPQSVLVVATSTMFNTVYGTALVALSPGD